MSSHYFKAEEFDYYYKSEPRELSVYDSLSWADNFGHTAEGQAGIVLRTLAEECRRLNRVIHAREISGEADSSAGYCASYDSYFAGVESSD